jgi:hypothetical protein
MKVYVPIFRVINYKIIKNKVTERPDGTLELDIRAQTKAVIEKYQQIC